jgi:Kef-type K+ transport system membrane component KefB
MEISFTSLAVVAAAGFTAPLVLGLAPRMRLPSVVLEIVLGILVGPSVLGWAKADEPVTIMALIGLSFLLLIAGLEVDYERFRGRLLEATGLGFLFSFGVALAVGFVVASRIGQDMGLISAANAAALIAVGLLSVLFFPLAALTILRPRPSRHARLSRPSSPDLARKPPARCACRSWA